MHSFVITQRLVERMHPVILVNVLIQLGFNTDSGSVFPVKRPPHNFCFVGASDIAAAGQCKEWVTEVIAEVEIDR